MEGSPFYGRRFALHSGLSEWTVGAQEEERWKIPFFFAIMEIFVKQIFNKIKEHEDMVTQN